MLLQQACVWYVSFLTAAWLKDRACLSEPWGLLQLAIPAGIALLGVILADAYAKPGLRPSVSQGRSPALGALLVLVSLQVVRISHPDFAVPSGISTYGCFLGLYSSSVIRGLLPPAAAQTQYLQGANVPVDWLKQQAERAEARGLTLLAALMLVLVIAMGVWK
jgi:hypothetical protein